MLTEQELQAIKEKADAYAGVKTPLRIKDYGAATKRVSTAYKDGAIETLTSERQKVKGLLADIQAVIDSPELNPHIIENKLKEALTNYNQSIK